MFEWNETNMELLKGKWAARESASHIGAEMGITRNAVIGKIHRMKLKKPVALPMPRKKRERKPPGGFRASTQHSSAVRGPDLSRIPPPLNGGIPLLMLDSFHCKAVVGLGDDNLALYCGHMRQHRANLGMSPYCVAHGNLYYNANYRPASRSTFPPFSK